MIAKFHSAPGHSMETTLTINIPPPERIRAAKGERLREKQMEKDSQGRAKEREMEDGNAVREKEGERMRKEERERERERIERERRSLAERGTTHKDKFQKMRDKYDRVTATHETHLQELDILNAKIKKLHAENDLLLDAVFLADTALYDRYFPSGSGFGPPPIGHPASQQHPPAISSSSHYYSSKPVHGHATYVQHPHELPMGAPVRSFSTSSRLMDNPPPSTSGPSPKPGHYYYQQQSHGQDIEPQEHSNSHSYYTHPSDAHHPPTHYRQSQYSTYRHYVPPTDYQGMLPPPLPIPEPDQPQPSLDTSQKEKRQSPHFEREKKYRNSPTDSSVRAKYGSDSDSDENWENRTKYYEHIRRHWGDLGRTEWGMERAFSDVREEEREGEEGERNVGKGADMEVDEAN